MHTTLFSPRHFLPIFLAIGAVLANSNLSAAELQLGTVSAWEKYARLTEQRIESEWRGAGDEGPFLVIDFDGKMQSERLRASLRRGEIYIRKLLTLENGREIEVDAGLIHHWMGAIFVPATRLDPLLRWIKNYDQHDKYFPEIERSRLIANSGDTYRIFFRLKRKKIITVVYNTEHTAVYFPHSSSRVSSKSFTTRIAQLDEPGTPQEEEMPIGKDGGYLWRLNSYWRFEERDGGVYVECESISLSRGIPFGVGWVLRGLVESVPRESLFSTLTSLRDGVRRSGLH